MNLKVSDIRHFVGARNFTVSRDFYVAMGWRLNFEVEGMAELQLGNHRFYLQDYYQQDWCENSMLHITVEDAQSWYINTKQILEDKVFGDARVKAPQAQAYGALVTFVWDPSGVLLHFAQAQESPS